MGLWIWPLMLWLAPCTVWPQTPSSVSPQGIPGTKMLHYIAAADSALVQERADEAVASYLLALGDAKAHNLDDYILSIQIKLGQCYGKLSRYEEALSNLKEAEANPLLDKMPGEKGKALSLIGAIYESLGSYTQAFEYQLKALEKRESTGDSLGIAESRYKIGSLYYYQKQYHKSLSYYESALAICEANPSIPPKYLFNCLSALGSVYEEMGEQEKSLAFNTRSYELAVKTGNDKNKAYALLNIGENHTNLGNYSQAKSNLKESLRLSKSLKIPRAEILAYQRLGELLLKEQRFEEAVGMLYEAYFLSKETGSKTLMLEILSRLSEAHETLSNYGAANQYLREYAALKDSVLNETSVKEISKLNALYELEKKESAIKLLEQEKELLKERKRADQLMNAILIGSSLVLLGLSGWLFYWMMEQRRSNKILQQLNSQIESQNRQLQSYNDELRQYAYVASHDLQEPLRTIGSFVTIIKRKYTDQLDDQAHQYMAFVTEGVTRLQRLLRDLLAYTRIEREKTDFEFLESIDIVQDVLDGLREVVRDSGANIHVDSASLPVIRGNRLRLGQVFQNLISNAIKFRGEAPPEVDVGCLIESGKQEYLFYVRDNGIGIPFDFQEKMFEMFTRLHSRETYEGSGIGLATCRKIIENHGGRIWAESEPGMGTAIFFTLPQPVLNKEYKEKSRLNRAAAL